MRRYTAQLPFDRLLRALVEQDRSDTPTSVLISALKACTSTKDLEWGKRVHATCNDTSISVSNCLINMYTKCGSLAEAQKVFADMPDQDVISWTTLIMGYVDNGESEIALDHFARMKVSSCSPNAETFVAALKACSSLASKQTGTHVVKLECLTQGLEIHFQALTRGYLSDIFLTGALIDMYANCRSMLDSRAVFDKTPLHNVVLWNALMLGYAENGETEIPLKLLVSMRHQGCEPNYRTFVACLKACAVSASREEPRAVDGQFIKPESLRKGQDVHSEAADLGFDSNVYVSNTLVDMYSKCGDMSSAREVFDKIATRSVVSWGALMLGYAENGKPHLAMETLSRMRAAGVSPSAPTFLAALKACSSSSSVSLHFGKAIHADVCRVGFLEREESSVLETCLMDAYSKCGRTGSAQQLFDALATRDIVTWNSLMTGYGREGETREVFETVKRMVEEGLRPNEVTFLCLLSACSHAGLVNRGKKVFQSMSSVHGVSAAIEHYHCLVDMLGRANLLEEAVEVVKTMPYKANAVTWRTLLSSSQKWKNETVGRFAFDKLMELGHSDPTVYLLFYGSLQNNAQ